MAILQTDPSGFVVWLGVLCSTWSAVSRGSTLRNWLDPEGDTSKICVADGNVMVSRCLGFNNSKRIHSFSFVLTQAKPCSQPIIAPRCCLLMALVTCLGGRYVVEQPKQSLLPRHKRVRWLTTVSRVTSLFCRLPLWNFASKDDHLIQPLCIIYYTPNTLACPCDAEVFRISWYMFHYGHFCPNPHLALSNSRWIAKFNRGPLKGWKSTYSEKKTTHVYKGPDGKKKWHGSKLLKITQCKA